MQTIDVVDEAALDVAASPGWTAERVELLTRLWDEGLPSAEIGRRMGLTKNAVLGKVYRIALNPRIVTVRTPMHNPFDFTGPACLWPIGHPGEPDFRFCGARPVRGRPYCERHCARAYCVPTDEPRGA